MSSQIPAPHAWQTEQGYRGAGPPSPWWETGCTFTAQPGFFPPTATELLPKAQGWQTSPRAGTRLPPPPPASPDPPHAPRVEAGTGGATLPLPNAFLSPASPAWVTAAPWYCHLGWRVLVPRKQGLLAGCEPSSAAPSTSCRAMSERPPAQQAGPFRDPERCGRGGPQMVWAIWGTTRSPVWGQGKMAWAFASPASTRSDVIGTMPASHSDTEPAQPLPLLAQGHCRRPEAAPCWSAQLRRRRRRLLGKGCLSGGSGWNFRHSGSAPPRPTGPACPSPSSEPPPPRCPGAPLPSRATRVRPWSTPVKGTASSIPSGFKPHHPLPTGQPGSVT